MKRVCVLLADTFAHRALGLLARSHLHARAGIWLRPCSSVHCLGMRMPLDLIFLDANNRIVRLEPSVLPSRAMRCAGARSVLELGNGSVSALGWQLADQLRVGVARRTQSSGRVWHSITVSASEHSN